MLDCEPGMSRAICTMHRPLRTALFAIALLIMPAPDVVCNSLSSAQALPCSRAVPCAPSDSAAGQVAGRLRRSCARTAPQLAHGLPGTCEGGGGRLCLRGGRVRDLCSGWQQSGRSGEMQACHPLLCRCTQATRPQRFCLHPQGQHARSRRWRTDCTPKNAVLQTRYRRCLSHCSAHIRGVL